MDFAMQNPFMLRVICDHIFIEKDVNFTFFLHDPNNIKKK